MAKRLHLPNAPETDVFRGLVKALKKNPQLLKVIKTWVVFDGTYDEVAEVTESKTPYLRVFPSTNNKAYLNTESTSTVPLLFNVVIWTDGTDVDDIMNLWNQVRKSLFPGDGSVQKLLESEQAYKISLTQPAYGVGKLSSNATMLSAEGLVQVDMYTNTRM